MLSRRKFLLTGAAGLAAYCGYRSFDSTTTDFEVTVSPVHLPALPMEFDGYRIAFLSDLHCGPYFPITWVEQALDLAYQTGAQLLLLGGDYLWTADSFLSSFFPLERENRFARLQGPELTISIFTALQQVLQRFSFPDGSLAVLGNHDRWEGPHVCRKLLQSAGVRVLVNEWHAVQRGQAQLQIFGTDDFWTGFPKIVPSAMPTQKRARLLLTHNPDYIAFVQNHFGEIFELGLAGHTHGGQIRFPGGIALKKNIRHQEFFEGLVQGPAFPVYTTRGIGVVEIPYRLNCRPEITVLELRAGDDNQVV